MTTEVFRWPAANSAPGLLAEPTFSAGRHRPVSRLSGPAVQLRHVGASCRNGVDQSFLAQGSYRPPASILAKVAASGAFASLFTTKLLTVEEMRTALHGAGGVGYRPRALQSSARLPLACPRPRTPAARTCAPASARGPGLSSVPANSGPPNC
jgi:hypothetical protein